MTRVRYWQILFPLLIAVSGCGSTPVAAPVIERSPNVARVLDPAAANVPQASPGAISPASSKAPPPETSHSGTAPENTAPPAQAAASLPPARLEEIPTVKPYREGDWRPEFHVVRKGDTLYSIALDYGQDYRELAAWNNLEDPGLIRIDQRLRLFPQEGAVETELPQPVALPAETPVAVPVKSDPKGRKLPYSDAALAQLTGASPASTVPVAAKPAPAIAVALPKPASKSPPTKNADAADGRLVWEWPSQGSVTYEFGRGANQKGVGIEGRLGQPVMASAPGKVVYSGSGLRGYGKLIIIKHNAAYLSVYAHNSQIMVKEGQSVAKGQKIAEMGNTDSDRVGLHFEIRRLGKPIDPMQYLPERNR